MLVPHVETQVSLTLFLVRPMTGVALRREDRAHVAIEFETFLRGHEAGSDEKRECEDVAHALANWQFSERHSLLDFRFSVFSDDFYREGARVPVDVQMSHVGKVVGLGDAAVLVRRRRAARMFLRHRTRGEVENAIA